MVEMAYGLPYKYEDHTTALQLMNALLEKINSQANFAWEQDQLVIIRILHFASVKSGNGQNVDLELLLHQLGGIFKPEDDNQEEDSTLQAALSTQVRKMNFENLGAAIQDRSEPRRNNQSRSPKSASTNVTMLTQLVLDMNAEIRSMSKAMMRSGISFDPIPQEQKPRERQAAGKQKGKFAGAAKKKLGLTRLLNVLLCRFQQNLKFPIPTARQQQSMEMLHLSPRPSSM
jgi:hypothetical protein